jgi:lipoate-protein ligase B
LTNQLEQTVINTLQHFGIVGERSDVNTGVWVGKNKISAVGLTASRWITMHGIALNVNCDLRNYERIVPCGIAQSDRGVCSIQGLHDTLAGHLSGESFAFEDPAHMTPADPVDIHAVAHKWMQEFGTVFNMDIESAHTTPHARGGASKVVSEEQRGREHDAAVRKLDDLVQSFPSIAQQKVQYYVDDVQQ